MTDATTLQDSAPVSWALDQLSRAQMAIRQGAPVNRIMLDLGKITSLRFGEAEAEAEKVIEIKADQVEAAPKPKLSDDALYGLAGRIVRMIEPHTESDKAALLAQLLVFFGNCVGRNPISKVGQTRHGTNLYLCVIGETARGRKGTSLNCIRDLFIRTDPTWVMDCVTSGTASGEGIVKAVEDKTDPESGHVIGPQRDPATGIVTPGSEKRLLLLEQEFARVFAAKGRDSSILGTILRDAWDGDRLATLTRHNPLRASDPHVSMIGHITHEELREILTDVDARNGFANRFLWCYSERSKTLPNPRQIEGDEYRSFVVELHQALDHGRRRHPDKPYRRNDRAERIWDDYYRSLDGREAKGLYADILARIDAQTQRLSVLYALLDRADCVSEQHLHAAISLMDYFDASAQFIFGTTLDAVSDKILRAAKDIGSISRGEIFGLFSRHISRRMIDEAIERLEEQGQVEAEKAVTGRGKKTIMVTALGVPS